MRQDNTHSLMRVRKHLCFSFTASPLLFRAFRQTKPVYRAQKYNHIACEPAKLINI